MPSCDSGQAQGAPPFIRITSLRAHSTVLPFQFHLPSEVDTYWETSWSSVAYATNNVIPAVTPYVPFPFL